MSTHRAPSQPLRDLRRTFQALCALVDREAFSFVWWPLMLALMLVSTVLGSLL